MQIAEDFANSATGFQMTAACDELLKRLALPKQFRYKDGQSNSCFHDGSLDTTMEILKEREAMNIRAKIEEMVRQCQRREIEVLEEEARAMIASGHKIEDLMVWQHNGDRWVGLKTDSAHDALLRRQQRVLDK